MSDRRKIDLEVTDLDGEVHIVSIDRGEVDFSDFRIGESVQMAVTMRLISNKAKVVPDLTLERLVFDILKCDPKTAHVRDYASGQDRVADLLDSVKAADTRDALTALWRDAKAAEVLAVGLENGPTVQEALAARAEEIAMDEARDEKAEAS